MHLQKECGVTQISLQNAEQIIKKFGKPIQIDFQGNCKKADYFVIVKWNAAAKNEYFIHKFSGFSWGYGGEGPKGLNRFLEMCGITELKQSDIPIDKYEKTSCQWAKDGKLYDISISWIKI